MPGSALRLAIAAAAMAVPLSALGQVPDQSARPGFDPTQQQARRQARQDVQTGGQNGGFRQGGGGRQGGGPGFQRGPGGRQGGFQTFQAPPTAPGDRQAQFQGGGVIPVAPVSQPAGLAQATAQPAAVAPLAPGAKPAPVDPLSNLGSKVSAVLDLTSAPRLLITDIEYGVADTSDLTVGQEYRDGWRLAAVGATSITMKKGEQSRQIALNFNTGAARLPVSAPALPTAPANSTPGGQGGQGRGGPLSFSNGGGQGAGARGAVPPTLPPGIAQLPITPQQMQQLQAQAQAAIANLPPEIANDPRTAAAISAIQNGNIGDLINQAQAAIGALGAGGGAPGGNFTFRLGPNAGLGAPAQ